MSHAPGRWQPGLLLCVLLLGACEGKPPPAPADQAVRPARLHQVEATGGSITQAFVGQVEAAQTIDLTFEVSGTLARLPAREGQSVASGALLAVLDRRDFELDVREAEVQLQIARQDLNRKRALLARAGISQSVVDDAQALFDLRQVYLAQAREALADTELRAPFDAYVTRRYLDNHAVVRSGDPVLRISDLGELVIAASIPERLLATVTAAEVQHMEASFAFLPDVRFPLSYRENRGEADPVAQTYEVTFSMDRPEQWNLLPGMTATVTIIRQGPAATPGVRVPGSALISTDDGGFAVWVYDPATQDVARRRVSASPLEGGDMLVSEGLAAGELIVATGAHQLQPGMRIRPLDDPAQ